MLLMKRLFYAMSKNDVAIVIPYYSMNLNYFEMISFRKAIEVFCDRSIYLLVPRRYAEVFSEEIKNVSVIYIEDKLLDSVKSYNAMMLSISFYEMFKEYRYILLYQLDAYVFEDTLDYYVKLGYDYIGAPWIKGAKYILDNHLELLNVGNGGLSLRNVKKTIDLLSLHIEIDFSQNEDLFFGAANGIELANGEKFCVAPVDEALKFSFDRDARLCFEKNDRKLPMGCHAWYKNDLSFWKKYIEIPNEKCIEHICVTDLDNVLPTANLLYLKYIDKYIKCKKWYLDLKKGKKCYIWGSGIWGNECGWLFQNIHFENYYYLDSDPQKIGKKKRGVKIFEPLGIVESDKEAFYIVAIKKDVKNAEKILVEKGFEKNINYILYCELIEEILEKYNLKFD